MRSSLPWVSLISNSLMVASGLGQVEEEAPGWDRTDDSSLDDARWKGVESPAAIGRSGSSRRSTGCCPSPGAVKRSLWPRMRVRPGKRRPAGRADHPNR
jgi:hypothetical protein